jgi:hypothetical protein
MVMRSSKPCSKKIPDKEASASTAGRLLLIRVYTDASGPELHCRKEKHKRKPEVEERRVNVASSSEFFP